MDHKERFDQLENLLVDLARKQDQQAEQIAEIIVVLNRQGEAISRQEDAINRQGEAINRQGDAISRIERRLDSIDDQIGDIITIFKLSEARHTEHDQRLDTLTAELKEQGRRTDEALQVQLQMLALMRVGNAKTDDLDRRLGLTENQEPRIQRLEDQVFRAAS